MRLVINTFDVIEAAKLRVDGWQLSAQVGSEQFFVWPHADRWPPDPRRSKQQARGMACGWQKGNPQSSPRECTHWPACGCCGGQTVERGGNAATIEQANRPGATARGDAGRMIG